MTITGNRESSLHWYNSLLQGRTFSIGRKNTSHERHDSGSNDFLSNSSEVAYAHAHLGLKLITSFPSNYKPFQPQIFLSV